MATNDFIDILRPVVDKFELLGEYISPGELARVRELAQEIRGIYDAAVERLTSGRVS